MKATDSSYGRFFPRPFPVQLFTTVRTVGRTADSNFIMLTCRKLGLIAQHALERLLASCPGEAVAPVAPVNNQESADEQKPGD